MSNKLDDRYRDRALWLDKPDNSLSAAQEAQRNADWDAKHMLQDPAERLGVDASATSATSTKGFPANVKLKQGEIPKRPIMPPNRVIREGDKVRVTDEDWLWRAYERWDLNNTIDQWNDKGINYAFEAFKAGFKLGEKQR